MNSWGSTGNILCGPRLDSLCFTIWEACPAVMLSSRYQYCVSLCSAAFCILQGREQLLESCTLLNAGDMGRRAYKQVLSKDAHACTLKVMHASHAC